MFNKLLSLSLAFCLAFTLNVYSKDKTEKKVSFDRKSAVDFSLAAARLFEVLTNYGKAEEEYDLVINLYDRNNPVALSRRALLRVKNLNNPSGAIEDADQAIQNSILRLNINYLKEALTAKGMVSFAIHKYKDAHWNCYFSHFLDNDFDETNLCLLYIAIANKEQEEVVRYSNSILNSKTKPNLNYGKALLARAIAYVQLKKYKEALKDFNELLENNPTNKELYSIRARIKMNLDQYKLAYEDFKKDSELNPQRHNYSQKGIALGMSGDDKAAQVEFEKAIQEDPTDWHSMSNLAIAYSKNENYKKSFEMANKSLELNPKCADCYSSIGTSMFYQGKFANAIEAYSKSIDLDIEQKRDDLYSEYSNRCEAYGELKMYDKALSDCDQSIKLKKNYPWSYKNRAKIKFYLNKKGEALSDALKAKALMSEKEFSPSKVDAHELESLLAKLQH